MAYSGKRIQNGEMYISDCIYFIDYNDWQISIIFGEIAPSCLRKSAR